MMQSPHDVAHTPLREQDAARQDEEVWTDEQDAGALSVPLPLLLLIGLLSTPTVLVSFVGLRSVWLTYGGLYYVWIVAPTAVLYLWRRSRQRVYVAWVRSLRRPSHQVALAVPAFVLIVAVNVALYHFLGRPIGVVPSQLRARLEPYGLTVDAPVFDAVALSWLVLLNPLMEEFFWRLFLFRLLLPHDIDGDEHASRCGGGGCARWWGTALAAAAMYASYHVPVALALLPWYFGPAAFVFLVVGGLALQLVVERFGMVVASAVHAAMDLVGAIIFVDCVWGLGLEEVYGRTTGAWWG